ncbi:hypothetical protein PG994_014585 [Apiospora phragmitis]|uniref:Uncharacterized protein n=1 Tax=Apiospora phragmitis TaxID=2905665 RepID=A0ABR1T4R8_9PEZI
MPRHRSRELRAAKKHRRDLLRAYPKTQVLPLGKACYPCISAWAYKYKPAFREVSEVGCAMVSPSSGRCGADKDGIVPGFGYVHSKKTCMDIGAALCRLVSG